MGSTKSQRSASQEDARELLMYSVMNCAKTIKNAEKGKIGAYTKSQIIWFKCNE